MIDCADFDVIRALQTQPHTHVHCTYVRTDIKCFYLQRVTIACYAERCISYSKSVRPSVRHTLALSQNDSSYDHGVFTGG